MKKILLTLGTLTTVVAPIAVVVSCSNQKTESKLDSQKKRWIEQVKYASMTDGEKTYLTNAVKASKTQAQLNGVGARIAASLGMTWSPTGGVSTAASTAETPIGNWDLIKPVSGDSFTYDEKTFELKADFTSTDVNDPTQWAKLYDAYFYLVSKADNDIRLTITCNNDNNGNKPETVTYLTHADRNKNGMPNGTWEHFVVLVEKRGHRDSISDLITGD